jgi:RNA polymerase sigma factor (sigma-70 family)
MSHELDQLKGGVLITDVKGKILYANKIITSSKGFSLKEMKGKTPGELWGGNMDEHFYKDLWTTIKEKRKSFHGEVINTDKKGQKNLEQLHIAPIMNPEGTIEYFLELQPVDPKIAKQFQHDFESVIQNQQRHPEDLWNLMRHWMGTSDLSPESNTRSSPAVFLENLVENHACFNLTEDSKLIELAKADSRYFRKIYEKYQAKIFNYFLYRVGMNIPMAEDLTQETFIRAFNALPRFEFRKIQYLSYLLMIAHNLLVNYYRISKPIFMEDMSVLPIPTDSSATENAEISLLWGAIHRLLPVEQTILTMKYRDSLSVREIAKKLNKTENAIKLHLSRARKKLRDYFEH